MKTLIATLLLLTLGRSSGSPLRRIRKVAISNPPEYTDVLSTMTKSSYHTKGSTIRSSFAPLTTKRTAKPLNLKMPGPATPLSHTDEETSPATLNFAPLKSMSTLDEEIMTSKPFHHPEVDDPGCICCCHENIIHAPPEDPTPQIVAEPKAACPDKCKCDQCCDNCAEYACKPIHMATQEQPVHVQETPSLTSCVCPQGCVKSNNEVNGHSAHFLNNTVNHSECGHETCICRTDKFKHIDEDNCMKIRKLPPCVTKCNNNFLGYHLNRKLNNDQNERVLKQPTSRTVSTTDMAQKYIKFTDSTAQMDAAYNPIKPMPTIPAMNTDDDVIIHNIMVAQPMMAPLDMTQIPVGLPAGYRIFQSNRIASRES